LEPVLEVTEDAITSSLRGMQNEGGKKGGEEEEVVVGE